MPRKDEPADGRAPDAKQKQDLAFLKGDWRSRTGRTATGERDSGRPTRWRQGKGKVSFCRRRHTCEPASALDGSSWYRGESQSKSRRTHLAEYGQFEVGADACQVQWHQPGDSRSYRVQIGLDPRLSAQFYILNDDLPPASYPSPTTLIAAPASSSSISASIRGLKVRMGS